MVIIITIKIIITTVVMVNHHDHDQVHENLWWWWRWCSSCFLLSFFSSSSSFLGLPIFLFFVFVSGDTGLKGIGLYKESHIGYSIPGMIFVILFPFLTSLYSSHSPTEFHSTKTLCKVSEENSHAMTNIALIMHKAY